MAPRIVALVDQMLRFLISNFTILDIFLFWHDYVLKHLIILLLVLLSLAILSSKYYIFFF